MRDSVVKLTHEELSNNKKRLGRRTPAYFPGKQPVSSNVSPFFKCDPLCREVFSMVSL